MDEAIEKCDNSNIYNVYKKIELAQIYRDFIQMPFNILQIYEYFCKICRFNG